MTVPLEALTQLSRMEEARRQVQRQLKLIDRQIVRCATALIPQMQRKRQGYRRGKAIDACMVLERYRSTLAALTAERQPEIDALSQKLARQDRAIAAFRERHLILPCCAASPRGAVDEGALLVGHAQSGRLRVAARPGLSSPVSLSARDGLGLRLLGVAAV